jgi:rod shape-determining protein MreC
VAVSRRSGRSRFTLILLLLTSITVITLDFRGQSSGIVDSVRETALDVFTPVKDAADSAFSPVRNAWNGVFAYDDLEDENARLKEQLASLQGDRDRVTEAEKQYKELLTTVDPAFAGNLPPVQARVITAPISNFEHSFEINVGSEDGVKEGMTVVAGKGLVGRVVRTSGDQSVVQLITDRDFAVGVRMQKSREVAIAAGQGPDEPMDVSFVDPEVKVFEGELVTTSGLPESAFPNGVPIGRIRSAVKKSGELEQEVTLDAAVDVERLTYVAVLLWEQKS